ncbi:MAG: hypothetical protein ACI4PF_04430 [Christensenellales bacterium]
MKNIIIKLLCSGWTSSKKYTIEQLSKYFYPIKNIVQYAKYYNGEIMGIQANNNKFWKYENIHNRNDLINDIINIKYNNIKDLSKFLILNRLANGDKYGIEF